MSEMASKMHLFCCSNPSGLLRSRGISVGANNSSSYYGGVVRCTKIWRRNELLKGRICASYGEETSVEKLPFVTSVGKLAVVTLLAQSMVVSSAFADVELLNESQRMRLEMLQQIEKSSQQQQQQAPIETQASPLPVAPALEAPSLTLEEELPSPSALSSPSASTSTPIEGPPAPVAENPAAIEELSPSPPAPIAENPATTEEPSPSSSAPIAETPAVIEEPFSPPSFSKNPNPNPVEVLTTPNIPSPSEAPAQSTAPQSTVVEAGSNNVLGVSGVVGAIVLGAYFLLGKKQQPVANSSSDASATQSKEGVGPASTSSSKAVEGNKLADD